MAIFNSYVKLPEGMRWKSTKSRLVLVEIHVEMSLIGALGRERPGKSLAAWFKASENGHASHAGHEAEWQVQLRLNFPGFPLIWEQHSLYHGYLVSILRY